MDVLRGLEDEMVTDEVVDEGLTDVEVAFEEVLLVLLVLMLEEEEVGFKELELEVIFLLLLLLVEEIFFELELLEVVLMLTTAALVVETGLATVVGLIDEEETLELDFELEETGLLELEVFAVVFTVDDVVGFFEEEVTVEDLVVTILT